MKLKITKVNEPQKFGDKGIKLLFDATGEDDKTLTYIAYAKRFFPLIKVDAEIDATVEVEEKGQFINRKITDIVGAPPSQEGKWRPDNTASIQRQTSLKELGESLRSGLFKDEALLKIYRDTILDMLQVKNPSPQITEIAQIATTPITNEQIQEITKLMSGEALKKGLQHYYKKSHIVELTQEEAVDCIARLKKGKEDK